MIVLVGRHSIWTLPCIIGKMGTILKTYTELVLWSKVIADEAPTPSLTCLLLFLSAFLS